MSRQKQAPPLVYSKAQQADLAAQGQGCCPTCGGPWGRLAIKVCRLCGGVIGGGHKYRMVPAGPGLFALEHRNCSEPTKR